MITMLDNPYIIEVSSLINEISKLKQELLSAIKTREIYSSQKKEDRSNILEIVDLNYTVSNSDSILLFKPRFTPAIKLLPQIDRLKIITLFQKIKLHFEDNPFYQTPEYIYHIFITNEKEENYKHSILCLVENQIHKTDEIYGDYIGIVKKTKTKLNVSIHSTRRDEFRDVVCSNKLFSEMKDVLIFLNKFVFEKIVEEISNRFKYLLSILHKGKENYEMLSQKYPKIPSSNDTEQLLIMGRKRLIANEFEGLFYLGYALEHWVKEKINLKHNINVNNQKLYNLIEFLKTDNWFPNQKVNILHKIRMEYNDLKHKPDYPINSKLTWNLYDQFQDIIKQD